MDGARPPGRAPFLRVIRPSRVSAPVVVGSPKGTAQRSILSIVARSILLAKSSLSGLPVVAGMTRHPILDGAFRQEPEESE